MKLYAYKQWMECSSSCGWMISWSEQPQEKVTLKDAIFLGYVELVAPKPTIDSTGSPNG